MSKFNGINNVKSSLSTTSAVLNKHASTSDSSDKSKSGGGIFFRIITSGVLLACVIGIGKFNNSYTNNAIGVCSNVVNYSVITKDNNEYFIDKIIKQITNYIG